MKKKLIKYGIIAGSLSLLILAVFSVRRAIIVSTKSHGVKKDLAVVISPPPPKEINQEIAISLPKSKLSIKYVVVSAELQDEILVKNEKVKASLGRTFLIFTLKIVNDSPQGIQVNSRDFLRITTDGGHEWLAPDIHNDPVEVQALSTKYTRVGLPVNKTDKQFKIRLGEISGEKTEFEIVF